MSRFVLILLVVIIGPLSSVVIAAGDPVAGKRKTQICVTCHTEDGNSSTPMWPKIAGLSEKYLHKQLMDFQKGESGPRFDASMVGMVQGLSNQDLENIAAYYAKQNITLGLIDQDYYEMGRQIYRGGNLSTGVTACAACHGANGRGNSLANFPRLSGQNAEYIELQLKKFRDGERTNDANGIMQDIALRMSEAEIEAVSSYVSGLH